MSVYEKLMNIQSELKAPKGQRNSFGNYNYRSCEDILEAVKPLLAKHQAALTISDTIELIGTRFYVKATAKLVDVVDGTMIENTAYARESESKRGMDDSQLTGATSSYARKYCLNGLFAIDDTKDADTNEYHEQQKKQEAKAVKTVEKPAQAEQNQQQIWRKNGKYYEAFSRDQWFNLGTMTAQQLDWVIGNQKFPKEMREQAEKVLTTGAA